MKHRTNREIPQAFPRRLRLDTGLELCFLAGDGWKRYCEKLEAERLAALEAEGAWHGRLAEALERYWGERP